MPAGPSNVDNYKGGESMTKYIIQVNKRWFVNNTPFRAFGGIPTLTEIKENAKYFSRKIDAEKRMHTLNFRFKTCDFTKKKFKKKYNIIKIQTELIEKELK